MSDSHIAALFEEWNTALQTGEPKNVTALYESNAILLPTISNQVRHNHEEIEDYFIHFLAKGPKGVINESNIRTFGNIAINSGIYTFTFSDGNSVQARFTYVYRWNGQRWLIVEHHSSALPEG
ncbi:MAG: SgcJ/EcaC family oxidoreductase [Pedosphaera sp.]|nr:SgcJ/EcaC family oxidoreductase [Pedosphaera sp.]|tara:strand:- start:301 stop:669 length:369 start_codon:yes stop_codon:yes gene_type:complete